MQCDFSGKTKSFGWVVTCKKCNLYDDCLYVKMVQCLSPLLGSDSIVVLPQLRPRLLESLPWSGVICECETTTFLWNSRIVVLLNNHVQCYSYILELGHCARIWFSQRSLSRYIICSVK